MLWFFRACPRSFWFPEIGSYTWSNPVSMGNEKRLARKTLHQPLAVLILLHASGPTFVAARGAEEHAVVPVGQVDGSDEEVSHPIHLKVLFEALEPVHNFFQLVCSKSDDDIALNMLTH